MKDTFKTKGTNKKYKEKLYIQCTLTNLNVFDVVEGYIKALIY